MVGACWVYFLLFCDHQGTESELCETKIGVAGPILPHKTFKGSLEKRYPYYTTWGTNIVAILNLLELDQFSYYYVFANTLNLINVKYILAYLNQNLQRKKPQRLYKTTIHILYNIGGKYCRNSSYFFYYFVNTKTPNLSHLK